MPIEAELFDGTVLEFPDDTKPSIVQSKAKELTFQRQGKPYFGAIGADVIKRAFEPPPATTLPPTPTTSRLNPGGLTTEQVARGIGEVGQQITPFPGLVGALSGVRKPGTLPELINPMPEVVTGAFSTVLEAIRSRDPSLAKDVEAVMAVGPVHGPPIGSIRPAIESVRGRLPFPRPTPAAPRTVDDLIARQRPATPPAAEVRAPVPVETPAAAPIASEAGSVPKRTIVDLVDEIKAEIKDKVIAEITDELRGVRTPREGQKLLAPPEKPPTVAPGSTIEAQPRVAPQPVSEVQPGAPSVIKAPEIEAPRQVKPKFTEATPIEKILPPRVAKAPKQILEDSDVAMSTFIKRQGGVNIPKNLREEFGGWNRLHNPKGLGVDVMADEAFNAGLLSEPTTAALLDSLKSGRKSARVSAGGVVSQEVEAMAESKIRQLVNMDAPMEFKGKTYTGAIREGQNVRLKDQPDKVLKKAEDILQVEEKIPFDIPPAQAAPFDPSRLKAAVLLDDGETIVGTAGRGGHKDIFEALPAQSQQRVKATGFFDPTDPNPGNFYPDSRAAEQAYNARAGIETPTPAPTRKIKGPGGELVEVAAEAAEAPKSANIQDRYALYLKTTDNPTNAGYMAFINRQASEFRQAKGLPETHPIGTRQDFTDFIRDNVEPPDIAMTKKAAPTFEQTPAGKQGVIPGAEGRTVPSAPLRPKRAQTEAPLELEQPGIRAKEPELFVTDPARRQEIKNSIAEGEMILKSGRKTSGAKMTEAELVAVKRSVETSKAKLGARTAETITADIEQLTDTATRRMEGANDQVLAARPRATDWMSNAEKKQLDNLKRELIHARKPRPTPESALSPEEIAARDEMRGMLGGEKPRGLTGIIKSEKGQVGSTEASPIVTGPRLAVGRSIEQSGKTVRKTMGEEGNELIDRLTKVRNDTERRTGMQSQPLEDAIKKLKREEYTNFVDVLEGKTKPASAAVSEAVKYADRARRVIARNAQAVDLQIKNPVTGEYAPWRPREDYFPHYSTQDFAKVVENPTKRAEIKAAIKEQLGPDATDVQAEKALQAMIKATRGREAHLEIARVYNDPDYVKDPRVFLKYIHDANRRIAIAEQFGGDLNRAETLLTAIGSKHGPKAEEFARVLTNRELRLEQVVDTGTQRIMEAARNYEVFTKLGRAFIPNMSQRAYTVIVAGAKNSAKGLAKEFTKEGKEFSRRAGVVNDEVLKEFYNEVSGATGEGRLRRAINIELAPFQWTEKGNRIHGALSGREFARESFNSLVRKPDNKRLRAELEKMGVDVDAALKRGALSEVDELRAAQNIVNRTQFKVDPMELPLFWSSPEGRLLTQFKTFSFKSGQFMKDEILKEIGKGNVKPFIRALLILPPAGYAVKKIQNLATLNKGDKDSLADYLAAVGVFGLFSDAFRTGARSGVGTVAGPALSDVGGAVDAFVQTRQRLTEGKKEPFGPLTKFVAGQAPVVGPSLKRLLSEKSEREKFAEQLGLERESMSRAKMKKQLGLTR